MKKAGTKKKTAKKEVKIPTKKEWLDKFFGKFKEFGDGMEYQNMIRHGK